MNDEQLEEYKNTLKRLHVGMKLKDESGNIKTITSIEYCEWSDKLITEEDICMMCPGRISLNKSHLKCHSNQSGGFLYEIVEEDFLDEEEFKL